jgi:hypothetical protein
MSENSKDDRSEHRKVARLSRAEKQYVRGIVHNLSLQKLTDQEIVNYLWEEKKIDIARSTVNAIKNQVEKQAENWYMELKQSRYLYLAHFKERIDTLYTVEKHLWEIVNNPNENTVDRRGALAEIHKTEITLCSLYDVSRYLTTTNESEIITRIREPLPKAIDNEESVMMSKHRAIEDLPALETIPNPIPIQPIIVTASSPIEEQEPSDIQEPEEEEETEAEYYLRTHPIKKR